MTTRLLLSLPCSRFLSLLSLGLALLSGPNPSLAQSGGVAAKLADQPYPGVMTVDVDLTDLQRKIMEVRQTLPVKPGPMTLFYPQWIPGSHSPVGPVGKLAGLRISANGVVIDWKRDTQDMYAFHLVVPSGVKSLELGFQYLSPVSEASGRVVMTADIIGLQWNTVVLYPAGHTARSIPVRPSATLPSGWKLASALDEARREGDRVVFKEVSLETLVDSPLWAGRYTERVALDTSGSAPVYLTLFADHPANLKASTEQIDAHKALVRQADGLFGSRPFQRYEFLLARSDHFSGFFF